MKRLMFLFAVLMLLLSTTLAYGEVKDFRYSSTLITNSSEETGFFQFKLDPKVYATMDPSLRDFRIYDKNSQEVGFTRLQLEAPTLQNTFKGLQIINKGIIDGAGLYSFTIENVPANVDLMMVKLDQPEYLVKAKIFGSNDNRTWQNLGTQTLYGINSNYNSFSLWGVDYRFLKFDYPVSKGEDLGIREAGYTVVKEVVLKPPETTFALTQTEKDKVTTILIDLGYKNRNSQSLKLSTVDKNFYRRGYIEASNDLKKWEPVTSFYLYQGIGEKDENLGVVYPLTQARYIKVIIENEDNVPVQFSAVKLQLKDVKLLAKDSAANAPFKVYWGNDQLNFPAYDIDQLLQEEKINLTSLPVFTLHDYKINEQYEQLQPPLTERYPFLLPVALAVAVIIVGIIQLKSFKRLEK